MNRIRRVMWWLADRQDERVGCVFANFLTCCDHAVQWWWPKERGHSGCRSSSKSRIDTYIDGDVIMREFFCKINPSLWIADQIEKSGYSFTGNLNTFTTVPRPIEDHIGEVFGRNNVFLAKKPLEQLVDVRHHPPPAYLMKCLVEEIVVMHS